MMRSQLLVLWLKTSRWLLATLCAALLAKASMPPVNFASAALIMFSPLVYLLLNCRYFHCAISGTIVGLFWHSEMPYALISWGNILPLASWLISGGLVALFLCVSKFVICRLSLSLVSFGVASVWTLLVFFCQELVNIPMAISPQLAFSNPELLSIGRYIGFYGLEFIFCLINALVGVLIFQIINFKIPHKDYFSTDNSSRFHSVKSQSLILALLCLIFSSLAIAYSLNRTSYGSFSSEINLYPIQPSIHHADAIAAGWSLFQRDENEKVVDDLTERALSFSDPGIIFWPEGGNNLANLGIKRRYEKLNKWMKNSKNDLLIASYERDTTGKKYNSVSLLNNQGVQATAHKTLLAPIAEKYLQPGQPTVLESKYARLGIAICFEALFNRHFDKLHQQSAQIFTVITDDASLANSFLADTHVAYAITNAIIYQTPLIFINNYGRSYLVDKQGKIEAVDQLGKTPHVNRWKIKLDQVNGVSPLPKYFFPFVSVLLLLLYTSKERQLNKPMIIGKVIPLVSLALFAAFGLLLEILILSHYNQQSFNNLYAQAKLRYFGRPAIDGFSPMYQQQEKSTCGAAALAFALTKMGDRIFERDILQQQLPNHSNGYNLLELKQIALQRGFVAKGVRSDWQAMPASRDNPVIAHLKEQHYVVVLYATDSAVSYFDPAYGKTFLKNRAEFESRWSGMLLTLSFADYLAKA